MRLPSAELCRPPQHRVEALQQHAQNEDRLPADDLLSEIEDVLWVYAASILQVCRKLSAILLSNRRCMQDCRYLLQLYNLALQGGNEVSVLCQDLG